MAKRPKELVSRAFKRDFPEFADRAKALGLRIKIMSGRRHEGTPIYCCDGVYQLNGFERFAESGRTFTHQDACNNIKRIFDGIEEGRAINAAMTEDDRFGRALAGLSEMKPKYQMFSTWRDFGGDSATIFYSYGYEGSVYLDGLRTVAQASTSQPDMAALIAALTADYARLNGLKAA